MITFGIECESIEKDTWGIARILNKTLEQLVLRPDLASGFRIRLYFKSAVPELPCLAHPMFTKSVVRIPFLPASFSLYYYVLLPLRAWRDGVDVMYFPNYMLPLLWWGRSVVLSAHDVYHEARNPHIPFRYRLAYRVFATWAAWRATRVIAMSESGRNRLALLYKIDPKRIAVNHLAVDRPEPALYPALHARSYILFLGQAFPRRHLLETLLAFEAVAKDDRALDMIVVGTDKYNPPMISELVASINTRLGRERVLYWPQRSDVDVQTLLRNSRAVTYISAEESFGLPPVEALANHSVPIVADNGVSRELFGDAAVFVPLPVSVPAVAEAITTAVHNESVRRTILGQAQRVTARFSWQKHTERLLEIVREVAGQYT